jgi:hypothetical protein
MVSWSVAENPQLSGYTCEWAEPNNYIFSRRNCLYWSESLSPPFKQIGKFPAPLWETMVSEVRPLQRLLRHFFYNVIPLKDGSLFVSFNKSFGILQNGKFRSLEGMLRPCRVLRSAAAMDKRGNIYFGEYLTNSERGPMRIYRYIPGENFVKTVHEFPAGVIRHIHGIYFDPFTESLWCLSGDIDGENRFTRSKDGFQTMDTIGAGDESWRAVSLLFTKEFIYYATDAEFEENSIIRLCRSTGERKWLGYINGPVYYSYKLGDHLFFAVTGELCPSQRDRRTTLWVVDKNEIPKEVISFEKDIFSVKYFLPAALYFPAGPGLGSELAFSVIGAKSVDGLTYSLSRMP